MNPEKKKRLDELMAKANLSPQEQAEMIAIKAEMKAQEIGKKKDTMEGGPTSEGEQQASAALASIRHEEKNEAGKVAASLGKGGKVKELAIGETWDLAGAKPQETPMNVPVEGQGQPVDNTDTGLPSKWGNFARVAGTGLGSMLGAAAAAKLGGANKEGWQAAMTGAATGATSEMNRQNINVQTEHAKARADRRKKRQEFESGRVEAAYEKVNELTSRFEEVEAMAGALPPEEEAKLTKVLDKIKAAQDPSTPGGEDITVKEAEDINRAGDALLRHLNRLAAEKKDEAAVSEGRRKGAAVSEAEIAAIQTATGMSREEIMASMGRRRAAEDEQLKTYPYAIEGGPTVQVRGRDRMQADISEKRMEGIQGRADERQAQRQGLQIEMALLRRGDQLDNQLADRIEGLQERMVMAEMLGGPEAKLEIEAQIQQLIEENRLRKEKGREALQGGQPVGDMSTGPPIAPATRPAGAGAAGNVDPASVRWKSSSTPR
jgi:hypothetical protein